MRIPPFSKLENKVYEQFSTQLHSFSCHIYRFIYLLFQFLHYLRMPDQYLMFVLN